MNIAVQKIVSDIGEAVPFLHHQGCCQLSPDINTVERVLEGLGRNPNVQGVLLVSLGCESVKAEKIKKSISEEKNVDLVRLQELGGTEK
ncbi:hypothetical protein AKJ41_02690 [candidate division MSBL1 archaeon SCGC-AAA259O05]|uniref:D-galactarate/Altronate dehydratase second domain-containing protein n=1 Tax=candidate division MSBL1 archaeon SCGC-AAA259O05 TaxID=1698271 RepID=A0A133V3T8_9EURY|nr:hypothetical protein AKJ41_02690 [candidate division MSBL1 archaeon SCGC-AAA259O05]